MITKVYSVRVPQYVAENLEKSKTEPKKAFAIGALLSAMHPDWDESKVDINEDDLTKQQRIIFLRELELLAQDNRNLKGLLFVFKHLLK